MSEDRSRTILVTEDDAPVRELIMATLQRHGYVTLAAADGQEAMDLIESSSQIVDVLISDVVMPGIGGLELAKLARAKRPGLPMVLISGHSRWQLPPDSLIEHVTLLGKPFTADQLVEAIEGAIERG
jgi:DNA-binding NtrC family response regulator